MQIIVCKLVHLLLATGDKATKPKPGAVAGTNKMLRHAGRIMKLTAILILGACLQIHATGLGQGITLTVKDAPLESVFKQVQKQTDYRFLYTSQLLEGAAKVSLTVKNVSVEVFMEVCLKGQKLDYEVNEKMVVVRPKVETNKNVYNKPSQVNKEPIKIIIVDENGAPAQGVNVVVKGSNKGATTNLKGECVFENLDGTAVIVITSIGYDRLELPIKNRLLITVQLKIAVGNLDEMQVIAYGTTSKRLNTGNVTTIKASEIEKQPVNNPLLALQGRVPGLVITQATGLPGSGVTVRIQGQNSILGGSDPLYIIDGIPYISQMPITVSGGENGILQSSGGKGYSPGGNGNPLSYINPDDIESIEVLKDADATSIYGSRAANGAILITTKTGKAGKTNLDINSQVGWGKVTRVLDLMNTQQYLDMRREALKNDNITITPTDANYDINGLWDTSRYTDWVKTILGGTARFTNVSASISGGNANFQYLIGSKYYKETSVFPGDFNDQNGSVHVNINSVSSNQRFKLQFTGGYLTDNNQLPTNDLTLTAYTLPPNAPNLYNEDGTLNWAPNLIGNSSWTNPLARLYNIYQNKTDNILSSLFVKGRLFSGFEISCRLGYNKLQIDEVATSSMLSQKPETRQNFKRGARYSLSSVRMFSLEPQINYEKKIINGELNILIGAAIQENKSKGQGIAGIGHPTEESMFDIRSATSVSILSSLDALYKYNALFARLSYNWQNKYILNLNARRDGSSHFGMKYRFHDFGSAGAAWIFSEESFFKRNIGFLSFGKIKANYGTSGNDQIGDYTYMDLYITRNSDLPYQGGSSIDVTGLSNPYLQWEETKKMSFGLDLGMISDKILLSIVYGNNRSSNQLIKYSLPAITGSTSIDKNFPAIVRNTSWEFSLNTINFVMKNFEWKSQLNLTIPENELIDFPGIEKTTYASFLFIDKPVNVVLAYNYLGVDPATGIYQFRKKNGDISSNPSFSDRTELINVNPKYYGGIQNSFRFRQLQIDVLLQFVKQIQSSNYTFAFGGFNPAGTNGYNQSASIINRWQKPGDINFIQKYSTVNGYVQWSNASLSNAGYVDASYARLKNLSISYDLSNKLAQKLYLRNCRFYVHGQNILTFSRFKGIDPENQSGASLTPLKTWVIGLKLGL